MKVLVCGGRDFGHTEPERQLIYRKLAELNPTFVIEGGANGADAVARSWCRWMEVPYKTYEADWHGLGRAAGPIRNREMLVDGTPDVVLAFPGGRGTANMIR